MAKRYVSVEKEVSFQGRIERWSNVYCYEMPDVSLSAHEAIQQAVLDAEKPVHGGNVTFKRTRVFTTRFLNGLSDSGDMFSVVERNVVGSGGTSAGDPYRECAVLVKWPLDRMVKLGGGLGRQRSLKKWIHTCAGIGLPVGVANGTDPMLTAHKVPFQTYAAAVRTPTGGSLVSPGDGSEPSGSAIIHPYMEHRQFPRGRKE